MRGLPELHTARLILRPAHPRLAKAAADYYARNQEFLRPFEPAFPEDFCTVAYQKALMRQDCRAAKENRGLRYWVFRKDAPHTAIGCVALNNIILGAFRSCYLAYKMDQTLLRQGYASEAVLAVVELAFRSLNLHRIEANILPRNAASLALARKCGFKEEGRSPKYLRINGVWEDHIHMVRLNEEGE